MTSAALVGNSMYSINITEKYRAYLNEIKPLWENMGRGYGTFPRGGAENPPQDNLCQKVLDFIELVSTNDENLLRKGDYLVYDLNAALKEYTHAPFSTLSQNQLARAILLDQTIWVLKAMLAPRRAVEIELQAVTTSTTDNELHEGQEELSDDSTFFKDSHDIFKWRIFLMCVANTNASFLSQISKFWLFILFTLTTIACVLTYKAVKTADSMLLDNMLYIIFAAVSAGAALSVVGFMLLGINKPVPLTDSEKRNLKTCEQFMDSSGNQNKLYDSPSEVRETCEKVWKKFEDLLENGYKTPHDVPRIETDPAELLDSPSLEAAPLLSPPGSVPQAK